ncbi:hypothetical protein Tco_1181675 [Tanacetum coccineum]
MVPLQSDTTRLVQNGCSFLGLWSEDPNQHLKDFLKLMDSLDLDGRKTPQQYPNVPKHHGESLSEKGINYAEGRRLRKLGLDEAWATIKRVAQYKDEGWNDAFTSEEEVMDNNFEILRTTRAQTEKLPTTPSLLIRDAVTTTRYDPLHKGVTFRLGGVEREMPFLEFGWRVGLYSERESRDVATLSGLRNAETVNSTRLTHMFWPTISDAGYNVGNTKEKYSRNPRIKLAHRCITMTITGRKETTNHVNK